MEVGQDIGAYGEMAMKHCGKVRAGSAKSSWAHGVAYGRTRISTVAVMVVVLGAAMARAQGGAEVRQPTAREKADVQTLRGVLSCDWQVVGRYECRRRAPQDCIRECVSAGAAYVLVTDKKMYRFSGGTAELNELAGGAVVVTGVVDGEKVRALSISDGEKHHGLRFWK